MFILLGILLIPLNYLGLFLSLKTNTPTLNLKLNSSNIRSIEGETHGHLRAIQSGIVLYYQDNNGSFPSSLNDLVPRYLTHIPPVKLGIKWEGENLNTWKLDPTQSTEITFQDMDDTTAWIYNNKKGNIKVNNSGVDSQGKKFYEWK